jgi:uncharacterized protein YwqG
MSLLNLGLQGVALARDELVGHTFEKDFKKCNGMSAVRKAAVAHEKNVAEHVPGIDTLSDEREQQEEEHMRMMEQLQQEDEELLSMMRGDEDHQNVFIQEGEQHAFDGLPSKASR